MTPRQREIMVNRIARAIVWKNSLMHEKDAAKNLAASIVRDMEGLASEASSTKRAVASIVKRLEETA